MARSVRRPPAEALCRTIARLEHATTPPSSKNVPIPYILGLEAATIPQTEDIVRAARRLVRGLPSSGGGKT